VPGSGGEDEDDDTVDAADDIDVDNKASPDVCRDSTSSICATSLSSDISLRTEQAGWEGGGGEEWKEWVGGRGKSIFFKGSIELEEGQH